MSFYGIELMIYEKGFITNTKDFSFVLVQLKRMNVYR